MRNFLIILLVCGIAFLGYEFVRRGKGPGSTSDGEARAEVSTLGNGQGVAPPAALSEDGFEEARVAKAPAKPVVLASGGAPVEQGERWSEALLGGELDSLNPDPELRSKLAGLERLAFETAVALRQPANPELGAAARRLSKGAPDRTDRVVLAAARELLDAGKAAAAVQVLGGQNRFLRAPGSEDTHAAILRALGELAPEARVLATSAYLNALTRGPVQVWRKPGYAVLQEAYKALQPALATTLFSRAGSWRSRKHEVRRGESLDRIANRFEKEFQVPMSAGLLQRVNGIRNPRLLRVGMRLRIPTDPIRVVVEKSTFSMKVFLGDVLFRLYDIGIGRPDRPTPTATFVVEEKQRKPAWTHPETGELIAYGDPRHLIGGYFVKLAHPSFDGYGLHGTADQQSIASRSSMGCIRLRAEDMANVFSYLPRRTKVDIRD